jgi:hypothetical protein
MSGPIDSVIRIQSYNQLLKKSKLSEKIKDLDQIFYSTHHDRLHTL